MRITTRIQLSALMFLEFFIWAMWYVTMGTYLATTLHATGLQIGTAYGMMALATIISPFFIGILADRYIAPKKLFALLHVIGGLLLLLVTRITDVSYFNWAILIYALTYAPTLALSSSITFAQLKSVDQSFAGIRVFGTIGWIIAGIGIDSIFHITNDHLGLTFQIAGFAALGLGILSWLMPLSVEENSPKIPEKTIFPAGRQEALTLLKKRSFLVFFMSSALIAIPLSFYYSLTNQFLNEINVTNATSKMTLGQFSEALFIVLLPFFMRKWGIKWIMVAGMVAWIVRFMLFRFGTPGEAAWVLTVGILLHGICYDFFFVAGQIYTDRMANPRFRNAAQGMITMVTYGAGMWLGSILSGFTASAGTVGTGLHNWGMIWTVPAVITAAVLIFFLIFFHPHNEKDMDVSVTKLS